MVHKGHFAYISLILQMKSHIWCLLIGALFLFLIISRWSCEGGGNENYQDEACMGDCYQKFLAPGVDKCNKVATGEFGRDQTMFYECLKKSFDPAALNDCYARCNK